MPSSDISINTPPTAELFRQMTGGTAMPDIHPDTKPQTALEELREFLEDRYDTVDGAGACDRPSANDWMRAGTMLEAVAQDLARMRADLREQARCLSEAKRREGQLVELLREAVANRFYDSTRSLAVSALLDRMNDALATNHNR